jgi:hypothetical protein
MDIDERLRSALHSRVDSVQAREGALSSIQRGVERRARRQRVARVISATVAAFAIGIGAFVGLQAVFRPTTSQRIGETTSSPAAITPHVSARVSIDALPAAVAAGEGGVWVTAQGNDQCDGRVVRIDPATNDVVATIRIDGYPNQVTTGAGGVWVQGGLCEGGIPSLATLLRIDPETNRTAATIPLGLDRSGDVAVGDAGIWATGSRRGQWAGEVVRIDPATNEVVARTPVSGDPRDVIAGEGGVWVLNITKPGASDSTTGLEVLHIDPATSEIVGRFPDAWSVGVGEGFVWVWTNRRGARPELVRIDPETDRPVGSPVPGDFLGFGGDNYVLSTLPVGGGGVWFRSVQLQGNVRAVQRLNADTLEVDGSVSLQGDPGMIDASLDPVSDALWIVTVKPRFVVTRIDLAQSPEPNTGAADRAEATAAFRSAPGWNAVNKTLKPTGDAPSVAWAANVSFVPETDPSGFPIETIRTLPPDGIVMTAIGPRPYTGGESFPRLRQPLDVAQGFCAHDNYEGQPAENVSKCRIDTMVGDELLNVTVWFGSNKPTDAMVAEANEQLGRLVLPGI